MKKLSGMLCGIVVGLLSGAAGAVTLDIDTVAMGLSSPLFVTHAPGDNSRLFVIEQAGRIRIIKNGALLARPFLNITSRIASGGERGLLGLAFHPNYAANRQFFVNYTNLSGHTVIERFECSTTDADSAVVATDTVLLTINQPFSNHNGGMIAFGPDGYLYIGMGDGGSGGDPDERAQNPLELLGKMLRINVDGGSLIPPDNPFVGNPSYRPEIWALGLRNPWRWSFDRSTGDMYIGDVGQGVLEEVSYQLAASNGGENYGWDIKEGTACFEPPSGCSSTGLTDPIYEYPHASGRCSITGGYVYRGCAMPDMQGRYFFADYCTSEIWSVRVIGGAATDLQNHTAELGLALAGLSSFGEDNRGEIYVCHFLGGRVLQIVADNGSNFCNTGCCQGIVGNVDGDPGGLTDPSDLQAMVDYVFFNGTISACFEENDVTQDATVDGSDLQALVDYIFFALPVPEC